jgi:hypothetical protein
MEVMTNTLEVATVMERTGQSREDVRSRTVEMVYLSGLEEFHFVRETTAPFGMFRVRTWRQSAHRRQSVIGDGTAVKSFP